MKNLLLLCAIFLSFLTTYHTAFTQDRPNIIFLITDDQRWDALGYSGNEIIQTPEMDRLAAEGAYFKNAFVTTPICAASRASIMTGQYERKHGYTFGQPPFSEQKIQETYFTAFKEAGYYNGYIGKFGVSYANQLEKTLFDVYQPHRTDFYYRLVNNQHQHLTDLVGDQAIQFIEQAPDNKPFCLTIGFNAPHAEDKSPDQYIWPDRLDTLYENIVIPAANQSSDKDFQAQPPFVREGFNRVRWHWRYETPEKYQRMVKGYYRMITTIDENIGRIRKALNEQQLAENTIIILIGDNGYFLGERQFAGKWLMYERSLRVPLIIFDPRSKKRQAVEDMVLNIDLYSTLLDYAGIPIAKTAQGVSLAPYTISSTRPSEKRDAFLCEHLWEFEPIPASEGIRTQNWKYFRYRSFPGFEELYDLKNDPLEQHNLAKQAAFQDQLTSLKARCDQLIREVN